MITDDNIQNSIQEAMDARSERTRIASDRVLEELSLIGFANIIDYLDMGTGGQPTVDLSSLTREQAAAIKEIRVENEGGGRRVHFRLSDKLSALIAMNKHLRTLPRTQKIIFAEIGAPHTAIEDQGAGDDESKLISAAPIPEGDRA